MAWLVPHAPPTSVDFPYRHINDYMRRVSVDPRDRIPHLLYINARRAIKKKQIQPDNLHYRDTMPFPIPPWPPPSKRLTIRILIYYAPVNSGKHQDRHEGLRRTKKKSIDIDKNIAKDINGRGLVLHAYDLSEDPQPYADLHTVGVVNYRSAGESVPQYYSLYDYAHKADELLRKYIMVTAAEAGARDETASGPHHSLSLDISRTPAQHPDDLSVLGTAETVHTQLRPGDHADGVENMYDESTTGSEQPSRSDGSPTPSGAGGPQGKTRRK